MKNPESLGGFYPYPFETGFERLDVLRS